MCSLEAAALLTYSRATHNTHVLFYCCTKLNKHIHSISNTVQKSLASISPSKPIAASSECVCEYMLILLQTTLCCKFKICNMQNTPFLTVKLYTCLLNQTKFPYRSSYLVPCFVRIYLTSELYILLLAEK